VIGQSDLKVIVRYAPDRCSGAVDNVGEVERQVI
jgi:hypothetical protein